MIAFPSLLAAQDADVDGWNDAAGVNLTADEGFGARHSGMSVTFAGFHADANAAVNAPASMNDVDDFTFSTAHAEKFGEAKFDNLALLVPIESRSSLGLGISRYGVSGIERFPEGVNPQVSRPVGEFSVADYLVVASFARRWGGLDVGAAFNFLYRQLDQDGFGMRADAMAQYTWDDRFRVGALVKGLIPSTAAWESGYNEIEPTDIHLAAALRIPAPYFYGTLQAAYQTEGLFQKRAKSQGEEFGSRIFSSPGKTLRAGNAGLEFLFDFGLAVRFGLSELGLGDDPLSAGTFGLGYSWRRILGLDYSFAPHPDLLSTHRIAIQFTPAFPKFDGRNFRTGGRKPASLAKEPEAQEMPVEDRLEEGEMFEPTPESREGAEMSAPAAQKSVPTTPGPAASMPVSTSPQPASVPAEPVPAATPAPAASTTPASPAPQAAPVAPAAPAPTAPTKGPAQEVLEMEEGEEAD